MEEANRSAFFSCCSLTASTKAANSPGGSQLGSGRPSQEREKGPRFNNFPRSGRRLLRTASWIVAYNITLGVQEEQKNLLGGWSGLGSMIPNQLLTFLHLLSQLTNGMNIIYIVFASGYLEELNWNQSEIRFYVAEPRTFAI